MIELNSGQLLQLTLTVECAAMALIAGVFFLVVRATRRDRGIGWAWGWAFFAALLGCEALTRAFPAQAIAFGYAGVAFGIACSWVTTRASFAFARVERVPAWALLAMGGAAAGAIALASNPVTASGMLPPELALIFAMAATGIALFSTPMHSRMSGVQTACAAAGLVTLFLGRTLVCGALLQSYGRQFNDLYWVVEAIGGGILAFVLAMGEIVALLEEIRDELEESNAALNGAMQGLEVAAKLDALTGLYNRYAFQTIVADLRRNRTLEGAVVVLDLNGLKRINDTYGHYAGDRAIRHCAQRLQDMVRASDYVFRWGGDEFVLLLFDVTPDVARDRLAHMEAPEPLQLNGHPAVELSVSWGVAPLAYDIESALKEADAQLYHQRRLIRSAAEKLGPV